MNLSQDKIFDVRIKLSRIMKKIQSIILDNDETAWIAYDQAIKLLSREPIINEVISNLIECRLLNKMNHNNLVLEMIY